MSDIDIFLFIQEARTNNNKKVISIVMMTAHQKGMKE